MFQHVPIDDVSVTVHDGAFDAENNYSRILAGELLDFSGSTIAYRDQLLAAHQQMIDSLCENPLVRQRVELATCAFHTDVTFQDFAPVDFYRQRHLVYPGTGLTALGAAMRVALDRTAERRRLLHSAGIECSQAFWMVLSDGCATDSEVLESLLPEMHQLQDSEQIAFVPVALSEADVSRMAALFRVAPILLDNLDFDALFSAFGRSLRTCSLARGTNRPDVIDIVRQELHTRSLFGDKLALPSPAPPRLPRK